MFYIISNNYIYSNYIISNSFLYNNILSNNFLSILIIYIKTNRNKINFFYSLNIFFLILG